LTRLNTHRAHARDADSCECPRKTTNYNRNNNYNSDCMNRRGRREAEDAEDGNEKYNNNSNSMVKNHRRSEPQRKRPRVAGPGPLP
jgi:hypothetical protein